MSKTIHYDSKFLESTDNLKRVVKKSLGLELNSEVAKGAAICLRHGRLYFEAAEKSPMEIKPLLIFYGIVNYSKGLVIARNLMKIEALPQAHGLRDISSQTSRLKELTVKSEGNGTFQQFNDSICKLDYVDYKNARLNRYDYITVPTAESSSLENRELTLKDILARMHRLASLYSETFCEDAKTIHCDISYSDRQYRLAELRITAGDTFNDAESRTHIIDNLKARYPFLEKWCLIEACGDSDHSFFKFINFDESSCAVISNKGGEMVNGQYDVGSSIIMGLRSKQYKCVNFWDITQPTGGSPESGTYLIEPFDKIWISEFSLYYLGMFLLSSLVRYRPQIWMHSLSRLATSDLPSDDAALALVEKFLEDTLNVFPSAVVKAMSMKTNSPPSE
ncbi:MAG: YaaC family protein [Phycisphaerae bacterium]